MPSKTGASVSPVLWKFCNQIPLALNVKFPESSQSLFQIPKLENLLWALELLQQCKIFFGKIVLQFVGCLLSGSVVGLTCHASQVCCSQSPCPCGRPRLTCASIGALNTRRQVWLSLLWGPWVLMHTRSSLSPPSISGRYEICF